MLASNRSGNQLVMACWRDLPDPRDPRAPEGGRTQVMLERPSWEHILDKHVLPGREPWADVFSAATVQRLFRLEDGLSSGAPDIEDALEGLGRQLRAALERPLALLYEVRRLGVGGRPPARRWILVLPSGATAHVHETKDGNRLATCYFPAYALVIRDRGDRWRRVVAHLVVRYGVFDTQRNALLLPTAEVVKFAPFKGPVKELQSAIRFVTPSKWGCCPELDGCPWRGRLGDWSAAEAPSPRRRHRLKPRRRRSPDEEELKL